MRTAMSPAIEQTYFYHTEANKAGLHPIRLKDSTAYQVLKPSDRETLIEINLLEFVHHHVPLNAHLSARFSTSANT